MNKLIEKHHLLDKEVIQMQINHAPDYKIRELKKKKLYLKEEIARNLENLRNSIQHHFKI
jgi:uncharacterized protein YdcH (DUF465 family)